MRGRFTACLLTALLACAGCYDRAPEPVPSQRPAPAPDLTLCELAARCGEAPQQIVQEIVIAGRVTSSDAADNFYRSLLLQEEGCGVELLAEVDDLHLLYPPGTLLAVSLQGLALDRRYGIVRIGVKEATGLARIGSRALLERHVVADPAEAIVPRPLALRPDALTGERCGTLIRCAPLTAVTESEETTERPIWRGYRRFAGDEGDTLTVYTSDYARYADAPVPEGPVALTGILQYGPDGAGGKTFLIKMRDEKDCTPLF